ncbi:MAG: hypothetical protein JHD16_06485 [Solirubrobacteraceae bacterium]|nr:hypothetical protein [Solirubrobacteraceae bacterium]
MDFKKIRKQAEKAVEKRGGSASLKGDFEEIKAIATSKGPASQKVKAAANALKNPGAASGGAKAPRQRGR